MVIVVTIVALTGRRLGRTDKWPYTGAAALPYRYLDAVRARGRSARDRQRRARSEGAARARRRARTHRRPRRRSRALRRSTDTRTCTASTRADDDFECALAEAATVRSVPTLAICRGIQILNVARGGTLYQHIPDDPGVPAHGQPGVAGGARRHEVAPRRATHSSPTSWARRRVTASCHHHQAIDQLGDGLRVVGRADRRHRRSARARRRSSCSRCSGIPRTPPTRIPRNSACSTRWSGGRGADPGAQLVLRHLAARVARHHVDHLDAAPGSSASSARRSCSARARRPSSARRPRPWARRTPRPSRRDRRQGCRAPPRRRPSGARRARLRPLWPRRSRPCG